MIDVSSSSTQPAETWLRLTGNKPSTDRTVSVSTNNDNIPELTSQSFKASRPLKACVEIRLAAFPLGRHLSESLTMSAIYSMILSVLVPWYYTDNGSYIGRHSMFFRAGPLYTNIPKYTDVYLSHLAYVTCKLCDHGPITWLPVLHYFWFSCFFFFF